MPKPNRSVIEERKELEEAFDCFTKNMWIEIMKKLGQGYLGWDNPDMQQYMKEQISNHLAKDDWVAVANLAMFLDNLEI